MGRDSMEHHVHGPASLRSPWNWHKFYAIVTRLKPLPRGRTLEARSQLYFTAFGASQIRNG